MRDQIERMQAEFRKTRNEALNSEIACLKRWRSGTSSESLHSTTQAVLFDAILADTALEDLAAQGNTLPNAPRRACQGPSRSPGAARESASRRSTPRSRCHPLRLRPGPRAHRRRGQRWQLDCVPAQFFVLRHIRGMYACACCQTIQAAPIPAQIIDRGKTKRAFVWADFGTYPYRRMP